MDTKTKRGNLPSWIFLSAIVLFALFLFRNFLHIGFFQDDFFLLEISKVTRISDIFSFFIPKTSVQFYRPLSVEMFYFLGQSLFGFRPVGFHLLAFGFFAISIYLVWKLSQYFFRNFRLRILVTFLYATASIHYDSLYWIANFSYILVIVLFLTSFLLARSNLLYRNLTVSVLFILGLLTSEFMVVFPVLLFLHFLISRQILINRRLIFILLAVLLLYGIFRFVLFHPSTSDYRFAADRSVFLSFRWFLFYFVNWAETIKDQMLNFYTIRSSFTVRFPMYVYFLVVQTGTFFLCTLFIPLILIVRGKFSTTFLKKKGLQLVLFFFWWIVCLVPIIFIKSQISPHRGSLAFIGFLIFSLLPLDLIWKTLHPNLRQIFLTIVCLSWIASTSATIMFNDEAHWIMRRSRIAAYWLRIAESWRTQPSNAGILNLALPDTEAKIALDNGRAFRVLYGKDTITVQQ